MALKVQRPVTVKLRASEGRPLRREEVDQLSDKRTVVAFPQKLRESHRYVAMLVAAGLNDLQIAERTGYSGNRVHQLKGAPAFQELVARLRHQVTDNMLESVDEYQRLAFGNMIRAERHIADALDEADEQGELIPIKTALAVSRDGADRFGYGKKNTNINVNVDFAAQLEAAIRRSGKDTVLGLKEINAVPSGGQGSPTTGEGSAVASTTPPPSNSLRRI